MASDKVVQGAIDRVPCPWCGKSNDFRDLDAQQLLDTGHICSCDHCERIMEIAAIGQIKALSVRQTDRVKRAPPGRQLPKGKPQPQQQRPGIMGVVKKLLR